MKHENLSDLIADSFGRIKSLHGFLEDDTDAAATDRAQMPDGHGEKILAMEKNFPVEDTPTRLREETHKAHSGGAFAATALADDPDALPRKDIKAHVFHDGHNVA